MISLVNICKEYKLDHEVVFCALKNINITIKDGEFVAIVGPSGSGKSTLMHIIGLLDTPSSGTISFGDKKTSELSDDALSTLRSETVGFVFQQFNLINKLSVLENIILPTVYARKKLEFDPGEKAQYLIKRFGLEGKERSYPNKISGGQQQRVAMARALIMNPKFILADEPTGNLDTKTGQEIMKLLKELNEKEKITIVLVTHDPAIAELAKRKIQIRDGEVV